jgi:hypothetical protein
LLEDEEHMNVLEEREESNFERKGVRERKIRKE